MEELVTSMDPVLRIMKEAKLPVDCESLGQLSLLHRAVVLGTHNKLKSYQSLINQTDSHSMTPLHYAVHLRDKHSVDILLEMGADPNFKNAETGFSALHNAAQIGYIDIIDSLLSREADINLQTDKGLNTPLHICCENEQFQCVNYLLSKDADVNIVNAMKRSPLHILTLKKGDLKLIRVIVEKLNGDITLLDNKQRNVLHYASVVNYKEAVLYYVSRKKIDINQTDFEGRSALHVVCLQGSKCFLNDADAGSHKLIMRILLDNHIDIKLRDRYNATAADILKFLFSTRTFQNDDSIALQVAIRHLEKIESSKDDQVEKQKQAQLAMEQLLLEEEREQQKSKKKGKSSKKK